MTQFATMEPLNKFVKLAMKPIKVASGFPNSEPKQENVTPSAKDAVDSQKKDKDARAESISAKR